MIFLSNAFSLQMLSKEDATINVKTVSADEVSNVDFISAIGHPDTAVVVSSILSKPVSCNRVSISLTQDDTLYVAQVVGGRLPEGCTTLPEGTVLKFLRVTLQ